jgi:hypothetical protein
MTLSDRSSLVLVLSGEKHAGCCPVLWPPMPVATA